MHRKKRIPWDLRLYLQPLLQLLRSITADIAIYKKTGSARIRARAMGEPLHSASACGTASSAANVLRSAINLSPTRAVSAMLARYCLSHAHLWTDSDET